jgi:hypothetical protein
MKFLKTYQYVTLDSCPLPGMLRAWSSNRLVLYNDQAMIVLTGLEASPDHAPPELIPGSVVVSRGRWIYRGICIEQQSAPCQAK